MTGVYGTDKPQYEKPAPLQPAGSAGPAILHTWCNPYGAETGGAKRYLGDTDAAKGVFHQWFCDRVAEVRCRMQCEHGHVGQVMNLCRKHFTEFKLRDMTFCPTCNRTDDHKCLLSLSEIS